MKTWIALAGILVVIIILSGCTQNTKTPREVNVCGDGICGVTEDCNTCIKDCACDSSQYCDANGVCKAPVCGDGICSATENESQSCCEDCGCIGDKICNKVTGTCQDKAIISDDTIREIATQYMRDNNISGNVTTIVDVYYKNQTVKQVNIDCKTSNVLYPCMVYLYVDSSGKVLESAATS